MAIHKWINANYPKTGRCEWCGTTKRKTEYASASHARYTWNRADWFEFCRPCHRRFDHRIPHEAIASNVGRSPGEETRAKIGAAHRKKVVSAETRERLAVARRGKTISREHRAKLLAAAKRPKSAETRAKMSAATKARKKAGTNGQGQAV